MNTRIFAVLQSLFFPMLSLAHMWLVGALQTGSCVLSALPIKHKEYIHTFVHRDSHTRVLVPSAGYSPAPHSEKPETAHVHPRRDRHKTMGDPHYGKTCSGRKLSRPDRRHKLIQAPQAARKSFFWSRLHPPSCSRRSRPSGRFCAWRPGSLRVLPRGPRLFSM